MPSKRRIRRDATPNTPHRQLIFLQAAIIACIFFNPSDNAAAVAVEVENEWSSVTSTDPVLQLSESNFESTVFHSGKNGLVKFYQSWCGHSIRLKPIWDQLASEAHPSIFIANVDCGAQNDLCRSFHITTYPTLRYYVNGTEYDYNDARSIDALREFVDSELAVQCNPILDLNLNADNTDDNSQTCSERARNYGSKWLEKDVGKVGQELKRLENLMVGSESSTTAELRSWMRERKDILKIIHKAKSDGVTMQEKENIKDGLSDEL